jgi:hypothetical protein
MRRLALFLAALVVASAAHAQNFPSPIFSGLSLRGAARYADSGFPTFATTQARAAMRADILAANGEGTNAFQALSVNGAVAGSTLANFLATATPDVVTHSGWALRGGAGTNPLVVSNFGAWFENNSNIVWAQEIDVNNEGATQTEGNDTGGVGLAVHTGSTYSPGDAISIRRFTGAGSGPGFLRGINIQGVRNIGINIEAMDSATFSGLTPAAPGTIAALRVKKSSDNWPRFQMDESGGLNWGGGSANFDAALYRVGTGTLQSSANINLDASRSYQINGTPVLGLSGTTTQIGGTKATFASAGPTWGNYSNIWSGFTANVGGYPTAAMFGLDAVGIAQALTGAIEIPASSTAGNHAAGVAGYARTLSSGQGAVGSFGFGGSGVAGGSAWGMNTVTTNAAVPNPSDGQGFDGGAVYGLELDFNVVKKAGSVEPNVPIRGIYFNGLSTTKGTNPIVRAIEVEALNTTGSKIPWDDGFYTNDGAAVRGINLGAALVNTGATSVGSQPIRMASYLSGALKVADIQSDPFGNIILTPSSGAGVNIPSTSSYQINGTVVLDGDAWTTYTPTASCGAGSGTWGTLTNAGKYKRVGKTVHFSFSVPLTTNGTCAGSLTIGLPVQASGTFVFMGREDAISGVMLQAKTISSATVNVLKYDNTYPGGTGASFIVTGTYEGV